MKPLLSICIPTYKRAEILKNTIESITTQEVFRKTELVQIVVSDNASSDKTPEVMQNFLLEFPQKIRYIRLTKPIDPHFNFENALKNGSGEFVKLLADATCFRKGQLEIFVKELQGNQSYNVILTQSLSTEVGKTRVIKSVEELLSSYSFNLSWISIFCFRRSTLFKLPDPFRYWFLFFPQMDVAFRLIKAGNPALSFNNRYFAPQPKLYYSNRNEAHIFGDCYLNFLEKYLLTGDISKKTYSKEKFNTLILQTIPFYFDSHHVFQKDKHPGYRTFWKSLPKYHKEPYFIIMLPFLILYMELRKIPLFGLVPYWIKTVLIAILFHWTPRMRFPMSNAQDNKTD